MNRPADVVPATDEADPVVFSFAGREFPLDARVGTLHDQILTRLKETSSRRVVFDVAGTKSLPSHMYGLFASLTTLGYDVLLREPSELVRDVLRIPRLDTLLRIEPPASGDGRPESER